MKHIVGTTLGVAGCTALLVAGVALVAGKDDIRKFRQCAACKDRADSPCRGNSRQDKQLKREVEWHEADYGHYQAREAG